jgi:PAS domain S-box-containing protein
MFWRKDGTTFPVQLSCAPILTDGALRGVVVTFFDVTERKQAEQRKALDHGITRAVSESATSDEANQKILQTVCEVLGWEWSAVWRVDKRANVLRCMTAWHRPEISVPEFEAATCRIAFVPGVGLPGCVWSNRRPAYIPDLTRDPNFPRAAVAARSGLRSGFAFPIYLGGNVVGVMEFFSRESREPSRDVLDLLNTLGAQIGLQIERKQAEETLRESERTFATLLSNLPGMVYRCLHDQDHTLTFASDGALPLTGYHPDDFLTKRVNFAQLILPDDQAAVWNDVAAAVEAKRPFVLTYRIRTAGGEEKWVWEQGQGVFSPNGDLLFLEGFIADITSQKLAEAERTKLSMILESSLNEIYVFDAGTLRFIHVNSGALQNLGYTLDAIRTMTPLDLKPEFSEASFRRMVSPLLQRQKDVIVFQTVHRRANGSLYPVEVHLQLMVSDGEQVFLAIIIDITERKRAEAALRDAQARLQQAQEEERKRIAREIHDALGQQLTMLRFGLVKLAQSEQLPSAELRNQVRAMIQPVDTTIDTVRRIATALRPAILDDLGLAAALEWLVTDFRAKTDTPCDVSLALLPEGLDDTRSLALFRILQEALTNVARHAQATRVMVGLRQIGDVLELEVRDNGRGLTEGQQTSPVAIGLFGMQERALLVGGTVTIQGRPNEGTTVTARIPLRNRQYQCNPPTSWG